MRVLGVEALSIRFIINPLERELEQSSKCKRARGVSSYAHDLCKIRLCFLRSQKPRREGRATMPFDMRTRRHENWPIRNALFYNKTHKIRPFKPGVRELMLITSSSPSSRFSLCIMSMLGLSTNIIDLISGFGIR